MDVCGFYFLGVVSVIDLAMKSLDNVNLKPVYCFATNFLSACLPVCYLQYDSLYVVYNKR